jgi:hypothetical protein
VELDAEPVRERVHSSGSCCEANGVKVKMVRIDISPVLT